MKVNVDSMATSICQGLPGDARGRHGCSAILDLLRMRHFVNKCRSGYASWICEMCQPNFMVVWTLSLFGGWMQCWCVGFYICTVAMELLVQVQTIMVWTYIFWEIYIVWCMCGIYVCFHLVKSILSNAQCDLVWD